MSTIPGTLGDDLLTGTDGDDSIYGGPGNDTLDGGLGADTLIGGSGLDSLAGGDGDDRLYDQDKDGGLDTLRGGAGNDLLSAYTGTGNKLLDGGDGQDSLYGGDGSDTLRGGPGSDSLAGDAGDDSLDGGDDGDTLIGGEGSDLLTGGAGDDFLYDQDGGLDTLHGGLGNDLLSGYTSFSNKWLSGDEGDDTLIGGGGADTLFGGAGLDSLVGDAGGDQLDGGYDNDTLIGGEGDDTLTGGQGLDSLVGGVGDDQLDGGEGNDTLFGGDGDDSLVGGSGDDQLFAQDGGSDTLRGGEGNDRVDAYTGTGPKQLDGGPGDDTLNGGIGDDTLNGGPGADRLRGFEGADTFVIDDLGDQIVDPTAEDTVNVEVSFAKLPSSLGAAEFAAGVQRLPYWVDALLPDEASGGRFASLVGLGSTMAYAFPAALPDYADPRHAGGFQPFNETQQARAREALAYVSTLVDLHFVEVTDPDQPNTLTFANNQQMGSAGYSSFPSEGAGGSDLYLNVDIPDNLTLEDASYALLTLIHELGHALGLKHPFAEPDAGGHVEDPPYLPEAEDRSDWTVMSYTSTAEDHALRFSALDIAALHYLYGPNPQARSGDDVYALDVSTSLFVWDGAGDDWLDAASAHEGVTLFLEPGFHGHVGPFASDLITAAGQVTVNFGTVIENASGSPFADRLWGNAVANRLEGGDGADTLHGLAGDDTLTGGAGGDWIDGGEGVDTAVFSLKRTAYAVSVDPNTGVVLISSSAEGADELVNVEIFRFEDIEVPLAFLDVAPSTNLVEDATLTAYGQVTATDINTDASLSFSTTASAAYGTFDLNATTGLWTYTLTNGTDGVASAVQSLAKGETLTEQFIVTVIDEFGATDTQTITVTITGTNDAPVATFTEAQFATEGGPVVSGQLTSIDIDKGSTATYTLVGQPIGGLSLSAAGAWSFDPAAEVYRYLTEGEELPITVTYLVTDEQGASSTASFALTVTGSNSPSSGLVALSGVAEEGGMLLAEVQGLSDPDGEVTVSWRWQQAVASGAELVDTQGWADIDGANTAAFDIADDQSMVGWTVRPIATVTDALGGVTTLQGDAQTITNVNDAPVGTLSIQGEAIEGGELVALVDLDDPDGIPDAGSGTPSIELQWLANGNPIEGANGNTLMLTPDLTGLVISVRANWTDSFAQAEQFVSDASKPVEPLPSETTLSGRAYHWKNHALLDKVVVAAGEGLTSTTDSLGDFQLVVPLNSSLSMSASRPIGDGTANSGISSADALAALRIAVGLNPNADPDGPGQLDKPDVSPYQIMAADVNNSGTVTSADALAILRMAVKLSTALPQEWLFVEETRDFWDESANGGQGAFALTRQKAGWDRDIHVEVPEGGSTVNLVGVLKGDVNGSWAPPTGSENLDLLDPTYFQDLAMLIGVPVAQWGV